MKSRTCKPHTAGNTLCGLIPKNVDICAKALKINPKTAIEKSAFIIFVFQRLPDRLGRSRRLVGLIHVLLQVIESLSPFLFLGAIYHVILRGNDHRDIFA